MKAGQLINRVTQQLQQASTDCPTPAGQTDQTASQPSNSADRDDIQPQVAAINQIFELYRFNYHNQFLKAFPDLNTLNMAKRLWLRLLSEFQPNTLLAAAEMTVKECNFLPNVYEVLSRCQRTSTHGLSDVYAAYREACRAPSPKISYQWSHPIVYFAGLATNWHFMASEPDSTVLPVFERNYELLLQRLANGESLEIEVPPAIPENSASPLSTQEQKQRLQRLLDDF